MLHQELLLAQLPTGRQGLQVSFTLTQHYRIYIKKIQINGKWRELFQDFSLTFWLLQVVVVVRVIMAAVVEQVGCLDFHKI
jgi:hypothetical protein